MVAELVWLEPVPDGDRSFLSRMPAQVSAIFPGTGRRPPETMHVPLGSTGDLEAPWVGERPSRRPIAVTRRWQSLPPGRPDRRPQTRDQRGRDYSGRNLFNPTTIRPIPRPHRFFNVSGCNPVDLRNRPHDQTYRGVPNGESGNTSDRINTSRRSSASGINAVHRYTSSMAVI